MARNLKPDKIFPYIALTLPAIVVYILVVYYPLVYSLFLSITDWDGASLHYKIVGIKNFIEMCKDQYVWSGILNTFEFTLFSTTIANILALLLALILNKKLMLRGYLKAVFFIPCLFSTIIISAVFGSILQYEGILNTLLNKAGLSFLAQDWFGTISTALPTIMAMHVWQWLGFGSVIYLAGLQAIPHEYYEAARIDGASKISIFFQITLPLLMPSITILTFLNLIGGLKLFDIPFILTKGGPGYATETLGTIIYNLGFNQFKMGYASAVSVALFIIILFFSILQLSFTRKREVEL